MIETIQHGSLKWEHITNPTEDDFRYLLEDYNFHPLDIEDCRGTNQRPKIDEYDDYYFLILHFPYFDKGNKNVRTREVKIFWGKDFIITIGKSHWVVKKLFDEVQECKEIVTAIKFLVDEGSYRYILSGSLLDVDLKDIRSAPVGYMDIFEMYPLDFEEFALASGVSMRVIDSLRNSFISYTPVDAIVHEQMMDLFRLYLIIGGMPSVVERYLATNNLQEVTQEQRAILALYRQDIAKYDPKNKLYLEDIFALIPSELNSKNKRFILKNLNVNFKFSRYQNSFLWLKNAGVALPAFCVAEPVVPLMLNKSANLFKLFLSDVGLLASMYMDGIQLKLLNREKDINFGSVYENAAAQELKAHGFDLYYFNSKKQGELDFVIERGGDALPIEIKSGKDYQRHAALENVMGNKDYAIPVAFVFQNDNVSDNGKIVYLPIYMLMFLQKEELLTPQIC